MKKALLIFCIALPVLARIGESPEQTDQRYGTPFATQDTPTGMTIRKYVVDAAGNLFTVGVVFQETKAVELYVMLPRKDKNWVSFKTEEHFSFLHRLLREHGFTVDPATMVTSQFTPNTKTTAYYHMQQQPTGPFMMIISETNFLLTKFGKATDRVMKEHGTFKPKE